MSPDDWDKLSRTLDSLLEMSPVEQASALDELRQTDPTFADELASLLREADTQDCFDQPPEPLLNDITHVQPPANLTRDQHEHYRFVSEIARGGMGIIYRVEDRRLGRPLAIKTLLPYARTFASAEQWFDREARITGRLQHPGIPPVHEWGKLADGSPFFAMKLIEGKTLSEVIREASWPTQRLGVFEQICHTLAYAHSRGVLHRDLKPSNIMVGAFGEVQVMDWGLATIVAEQQHQWSLSDVEPQGVVGTPAYMPPEQARGECVDERSDVFGLGALLYAMFTGQPPYSGTTEEVLRQAAKADLEPVLYQWANAGTDPELIAIARRCLAARPDDRYRHAGELAGAITAYRANVQERLQQAEIARERAAVQATEERRRRRVLLALALVLVVSVIGALGVWGWSERLAAKRQEQASTINGQLARTFDEAEQNRQTIHTVLTNPKIAYTWQSNPQLWQEHVQQLRSLLDQARQGAEHDRELVTPENRRRLQELEQHMQAEETHLRFAQQVDSLRLTLFERTQPNLNDRLDKAYEALFREFGWDILSAEQDNLATLPTSPVKFVALSALDDWGRALINGLPRNDDRLRRILDVARTLDHDEWRQRFHHWQVWTDAKQLDALTANINCDEHTPTMLRLIASLRSHHRLNAADLLQRTLQRYPNDFWVLCQQGFDTHNSDSSTAMSAYRAALALRPHSSPVLNNLGAIYGMRQDYANADDCFRRAVQGQPRYVSAILNQAKSALEQANYRQVFHFARQALAIDSSAGDAYNVMGSAYAATDEYELAQQHFARALQTNPTEKRYLDNHRKLTAVTQARARVLKHEEGYGVTPLATLEKGLTDRVNAQQPLDWFPDLEQHHRACVRVQLQAGHVYQADVRATDFDPLLRVEDDQLAPLYFNDQFRKPDTTQARIIIVPQRTGIYRLVVVSANPKTMGQFSLQLRPTKVHYPAIDSNGQLTRQSRMVNKRYQQITTVQLNANLPVIFTMRSQAFRTAMRIYDATGKIELANNEWMHPYDKHWSRIDFTPKTAGTYQLVLTTADAEHVGPYTIRFEQFVNLDSPR